MFSRACNFPFAILQVRFGVQDNLRTSLWLFMGSFRRTKVLIASRVRVPHQPFLVGLEKRITENSQRIYF